MVIKYEVSVAEMKALVELISELCHRAGINEVVTRSLFQKLNDRDFK